MSRTVVGKQNTPPLRSGDLLLAPLSVDLFGRRLDDVGPRETSASSSVEVNRRLSNVSSPLGQDEQGARFVYCK